MAAAQVVRVQDGGNPVFQLTFELGPDGKQRPAPIVVGRPGEQVALVLYGTGFREGLRASLRVVADNIEPEFINAFFAGPVPGIAGLEQANFFVPAGWAAAGTTEFTLLVDGLAANNVVLSLKGQ